VNRVAIAGNTAIGTPELLGALGQYAGRSYDFSGLSALAACVSAYYQAHGYPFARAYLPRQQLTDGQLRIEVLEGRYDRVLAHGDAQLSAGAQPFLSALAPGALIESQRLERATLILDDLPGIKTVPVIRPGKQVGTGDLLVEVRRDHRFAGEVGVDNLGSIYTGRARVHANLDLDSPFMLGDQVLLQALYTDKQMWFGSASYAVPVGASGLRARVGIAHSYYALADNFSALDASGTADVGSATLSYPLVRSQPRNVTLSAGYEHKRLNDRQGATDSASRKHTDTIPLTVGFDLRDSLLGGAVTYGALSVTAGRLRLDSSVLATDAASARTQGSFGKLNLDLARIQGVAPGLDLYGRISAQWAGKNLDSSQKFGLGGKNGVRAYPSGEGYGDQGAFAQAEVRYALGAFAPYAFYDIGHVTLNHNTWAAGENSRQLAGGGTGLRYLDGRVKAELVLAWRIQGGAPRSDTRTSQPVMWANLDYRF
jgi:hemolysin activation/secretion protein